MKIAVVCNSTLLKSSLEFYLKRYIVSKESAEFFVCDQLFSLDRPIFLVGHSSKVDLRVPFTKDKLLYSLDKFYSALDRSDISLMPGEIAPFLEKLNRKNHQKIEKLARKIL